MSAVILKTLAGGLGVAAGVAGGALPAVADSWGPATQSTSGASATCWVQSADRYVHDDLAYIQCDLSDTEADGDSVYVGWKQDGYATISLYNSNGNGTTKYVTDGRYNPDGSFGTLKWRVCRDQQAPFSDNCSSWIEYNPK